MSREGADMGAAGIYARISRDPEDDGLGVRRQTKDGRDLAKRRGWSPVVFQDDDVSSTVPLGERPGGRRLLDALASGEVRHVVSWANDRLYRDPRDQLVLLDAVRAAGGTIATVRDGDIDPGSEAGAMTMGILANVGEFERERTRKRVQRKMEELARAGKQSGGGTRPFGFEQDRVTIREPEAVLIREAADRVLGGASLGSIAADWNGRGIRTVTGRPWRTQVLRTILMAPRTAGLREHRGEVVATAEWEGILDREAHERLRAILADPRRRTTRGASRRYLLTGGFAVCGLCGAKLVARPRDDGRRCYVCSSGPNFNGCGKIRALAEPLEDHVIEAVMTALDSPDLSDALRATESADDGAADVGALTEAERALEELARDYYADRAISKPEYLAAREALEGRIAEARRKLAVRQGSAALASVPSGAEAMAEAWAAGDLEWRRAVLDAILAEVKVGPAVRGRNRFDAGRIEIRWRA